MFGVIGELLITAGVLTLLYVGWQLWIGDLIYGAQRSAAGQELSQEWEQEYAAPSPSASPNESDPEEPALVEPSSCRNPLTARSSR